MDYNNQNNQFEQYNQGQYGAQPDMNQYNQYGMGQVPPVQPQMGYQNYQQPMAYNPPISKKEFCKYYASRGIQNSIIAAAVMLYIGAAINFAYLFLVMGNIGALGDAVLFLILGLCTQLLLSRVAAVLTAVYALLTLIFYLIFLGQTGGVLLIAAAICSCIGTFKLEAEYQRFIGRK